MLIKNTVYEIMFNIKGRFKGFICDFAGKPRTKIQSIISNL